MRHPPGTHRPAHRPKVLRSPHKRQGHAPGAFQRDAIVRYRWRDRRDYLMLVAAVAASDSTLHADELALLKRWMHLFQLGPKSCEAVLRVAHQQQVDAERLCGRLASTDLNYSVLLDMMGMAMADGVLMDDEILLLQGVSSALGIDPVDFQILIEFVHSAHQAAQLGNPEPLYEYNIESAFALLKKRHVHLFEHTLLCVTYPEYDRQLKQRWKHFKATPHHG